MGFFKFLKKREPSMSDMDSLEIPPAPNSDISQEMPEMDMPTDTNDEPKFDLDEEFNIPYKEDIDDQEVESKPMPKKAMTSRVTNKPIYVKADVYRDVITEMSHVKELLKRSEEGISRIGSDLGNENKEFEKWHNTLKDIQRRMLIVDKNLFKR